MESIFEQGSFGRYAHVNLDESMAPVLEHSQFDIGKTTVFISHRHDDLNDLKGVLGFLEQTYGVMVYIDSHDPTMPKKTSGQTGLNLRERIKKCDKFILLATNGAIDSKWCNWELGYGDAHKFIDHIALFPMKPEGSHDSQYKGTEYMSIYPYIAHFDGSEKTSNGELIPCGYYVCRPERNPSYIALTKLSDWFAKR